MKAFFLFASLFIAAQAFSQNILDSVVSEELDVPVYKKTQRMPEFLISKSAFADLIDQNLNYPDSSFFKGVQGTVLVGFIVNEDSTLSNFHIRKGIDAELNREALRLAQIIKKAKPGSIDGKYVKVLMSMPIKFNVNEYGYHKYLLHGRPRDTISLSKLAVDSSLLPEGVYKVVDHMPEFPGGDKGLADFIKTNIKYPEVDRINDVQGKVLVGFVVDEDGSISNIVVKKGVDKSIDDEAIRVVKLLPKFSPGTFKGNPVKVAYVLPIMFKFKFIPPKFVGN